MIKLNTVTTVQYLFICRRLFNIMLLKEIQETLDSFYYPLRTKIEQCISNCTSIKKEDLQKFEDEAFRYATIHTEDSFKRCFNDPTKDNAMERLFSFINSDIRDYEEILNELIETCFIGTNSHQSEAIGVQIIDTSGGNSDNV
jgi:hypothetical protein